MKLRTIKCLGLSLAVAAGLTSAANAQVVYTWVQGNYTTYPLGTTPTSSGTLTVSGGIVTSFSFTENPGGTENAISLFYSGGTGTGFGNATVTLLGDLDVVLGGQSYQNSVPNGFNLTFGPGSTGPNEQYVTDNGTIGGDWVPAAVPEPTTVISGALLLLPFGASTLRILRRNRVA